MSAVQMKALAAGAAALALALVAGLSLAISLGAPRKPIGSVNPEVGTDLFYREVYRVEPIDYINRLHVLFSDSQRFGFTVPKLRDPQNPEKPKRLTRDERGLTNNTCVRVEGYEYLFGHVIPGIRWDKDQGRRMKEVEIPGKDKNRAWQSIMEIEFSRLRVAQSVEIMVGEATRLYDTALVKYHLWNRDRVPHTVGIRVMLDTFIGANDGVPFYLTPVDDQPERLVDSLAILTQKQIPGFVMALENGNLNDRNATVAVLGTKIKGFEPMEKLVLCRWPENSEARWGGSRSPGDWQFRPMNEPAGKPADSAVVMYWAEATMKPGEQRVLAFTYGLGRITGEYDNELERNARMRLMVAHKAKEKKPFPVVAYVKGQDAGQTVTLKLPAGLAFAPGQSPRQTAPKATKHGYSQVTWQVVGNKAGQYILQADAPNIGVASERVFVRAESMWD